MAVIGSLGRTALSFLVVVATAVVCHADDCGPTAYAYEDRVVFFTCSKSGSPEFDVILLDDATLLKVGGRVPVSVARSFDAAVNYKNQWIVLTWDRVEIYDLADPAHPVVAAKFHLEKQTSAPGYPRFERVAENKFLVLAGATAAELTAEGDGPKWTLAEIPLTAEHRKKMAEMPEERFSEHNNHPVVVRETPKFRYEVVWKHRARTGEFISRQHLRKIDKAIQRTVSDLVLGERLETID
jgi:hypothetical protein